MQDLVNSFKPVNALDITAVTADGTTVGNSIDRDGFESVSFVFETGAHSAGTATPLIEHSDDNSNWTEVTDEFLIKTEASAALSAANSVSKIGYNGGKQYSRISSVNSGTANLTVSAIAILGNARHNID